MESSLSDSNTPVDPRQVLAEVQEAYDCAGNELREAISGLSEGEAGQQPAEGEWSVKQVLAHLSVVERSIHCHIGQIIVGGGDVESRGNPTVLPERLRAVLATSPTMSELLTRFAQDQTETLALFEAVGPMIVARKAQCRRIVETLLAMTPHTREHIRQIQQVVKAVGQCPMEKEGEGE